MFNMLYLCLTFVFMFNIQGNLFYRNKIKNTYYMKDISEKKGTVLHFRISLKVWSNGR